ncbi:hypothetical protein GCM10009839_56530 [Catenulispora yoronensis]|uniref:Secreted protein n=1 Tax=Catenulispora yoronensis TaxID=450799 RepID=A0ABN2UYH2_9ACTN
MIRRLTVVAALVGGTLTALPTAPAQAVSTCRLNSECVTTYYTNVSRTQIVGQITVFCDGSTSEWGTLRGFPVVQNVPCGGPALRTGS